MKQEILIFNSTQAASPMIIKGTLQKYFDAAAFPVRMIDISDIRNDILKTTSGLIVFPGVNNEKSDYQTLFRQSELAKYRSFIEDDGNVSLNICGGAFFASRLIGYVSYTTTPRHFMSLNPLFNGRAIGPMAPYAMKPDPETGTVLPRTAPVQFKNVTGDWEVTEMFYANGPALFPDDPNDPNTEVLMRFHELPHNPIASLRQQVGRGALYMVSPHPENIFIPVSNKTPTKIRALSDTLARNQAGLHNFLTMISHRIQKDLAP